MPDLMANICRLLDIKRVNTSGYHPQTDGLVESFIRPSLRCSPCMSRSMVKTGIATSLACFMPTESQLKNRRVVWLVDKQDESSTLFH